MHYLMEAIVSPQYADDIEGAVTAALEKYEEGREDEDGFINPHAFWDFFVIGGRYDKEKLVQRFDQDTMKEFYDQLTERGVTVAGVQCGKPELSPASQEPEVDELFRSFFPEWEGPCPLFQHGLNSQYDNADGWPNVCKLSEVPRTYKCYRVIILSAGYQGRPHIVNMFSRSVFNGATFLDTEWGGNLLDAVDLHHDKIKNYKEEYRDKNTITGEWITVTIDYHT